MQIGTRVGAISHANNDTVWLYGYGRYMGEEIPPMEVRLFGSTLKAPNPKIMLDDGKTVWGCECWWGEEDMVRNSINERGIEMVDIEEDRRKYP